MSSPAIRFAGFTEDWEQRKLYEISDKVMEKNVNRAYTETLTNSAEFGIISQRDFFDKNIANNDNIDGYYIVRHNDFVYNPRISTFAPVGPIKRNKLGRSGIMSPLYYVFRTHDIDQTYLEHFFATAGWHKFMAFNGDSGARSDRFSIKNSVFREMPLPYPSIAEQKKIGKQCDTLDRLITLHQREHDKTVNIKKALLEKMLPKDGEDKPEIRFAGFTDDWEERKLGDIATVSSGYMGDSLLNDGKYKLTRIETISDGFVDLSKVGFTNSQPNASYRLNKGDILYSNINSLSHIGKVAIYHGNLPLYHGINLLRVAVHESQNPAFLFYQLNTGSKKKWANAHANKAVSQASINQSLLAQQQIQLCEIEEQSRIGVFFSNIDRLIALHQSELTKLQNIKKALLEKMFV